MAGTLFGPVHDSPVLRGASGAGRARILQVELQDEIVFIFRYNSKYILIRGKMTPGLAAITSDENHQGDLLIANLGLALCYEDAWCGSAAHPCLPSGDEHGTEYLRQS